MKTSIFNILIIISLLVLVVSCANPEKPKGSVLHEIKSTEKKTPGKIVFDKEIHNFGTLKDGEIISFSFVFRNTGGSPFKIIKADKFKWQLINIAGPVIIVILGGFLYSYFRRKKYAGN